MQVIEKKQKQKRDRYEMHKYWGKKPASNLNKLIEKYSNVGDILLDPFSGYGVFSCEAYILGRNIISNDLNPISNFIQYQLFETQVDLEKFKSEWDLIKNEFEQYINFWFGFEYDNENQIAISVLRNKEDEILKCKYKLNNKGNQIKYSYSNREKLNLSTKESEYEIEDWYPEIPLILNSRISAKDGMKIEDLFTKRTLACHSRLFSLINTHSSGNELSLFKLAFTSNLANCSKLVPPIKTRDEMAQGAWMTGFYIGDTYIENNVLHYFSNRINKIIKGKEDYFNTIEENNLIQRVGSIDNYNAFNQISSSYLITQNDCKNLALDNNSVDYVFTDPPYGDSVPYFEQSIIWNAWLELTVDYENELVISDSNERNKTINNYELGMEKSIAEIYRVLRTNGYFSLTYHSLSGAEWRSITNGCIRAGFRLHNYEWIVQKTFTPRQINRSKTVKGDILITLIKNENPIEPREINYNEAEELFIDLFNVYTEEARDTNEIFMGLINYIFDEAIILPEIDLYKILKQNFKHSEDGVWMQKLN